MEAFDLLHPQIGVAPACAAVQISRATLYRERARRCRLSTGQGAPGARRRAPLALTGVERERLLEVLNSDRFVDCAPSTIYATLLDEGVYLASVRTMYRVLANAGQSRERRLQSAHPAYAKPELLATRPNEVWSWDITKLKGPAKWTCFHLYVILDIFSRYVVGWLIAPKESAQLAMHLISETIAKHHISPDSLTLHADRGSSMRSKPVAALLVDLDVAKSHSRPHVSDDNPYSEAQFKTLKYRPDFPARFGSIEDARAYCQQFFPWYNDMHRHSGIALMTPASMHFGQAQELLRTRNGTLQDAFLAHPKRFKGLLPRAPELPTAAWINPPKKEAAPNPQSSPCTLNSTTQVSHSH